MVVPTILIEKQLSYIVENVLTIKMDHDEEDEH